MIARALVLLACFAGAAAAEPVFKCRDADGRLSYQDKPCPPGTEQPAPAIDPAPIVDPAAAAPAPAAPPARAPDEVAPAYRPPPPPPATTYRCTDAVSGKTYVSSTPTGSGRYVPLWTVLPAGGGVKGGGTTAQADLPPMTSPPPASLAGSYTYVEDRCRPMPLGEQCGYWRQRLDEVGTRKRTAFNDTRPQLEQEEDGLRSSLATYCR